MSTQRVWKPIRIQDQSKPESNTWKLSKLKVYWAVTILLKYSVEVVKAGVQYFTWSYWIIWSCSRLIQPNPRKFQKYDPNPTQPMGEPNQCPCLCSGILRSRIVHRLCGSAILNTNNYTVALDWFLQPCTNSLPQRNECETYSWCIGSLYSHDQVHTIRVTVFGLQHWHAWPTCSLHGEQKRILRWVSEYIV